MESEIKTAFHAEAAFLKARNESEPTPSSELCSRREEIDRQCDEQIESYMQQLQELRHRAVMEIKAVSAMRGICLGFIVGAFCTLVQHRTRSTDPNFYELKGLIANGPTGLGKDKRCPRDSELDCSIVDAVDFK